jgi:peptidoglycan/xylan/chitin deacetylase (PgdA/CDA1 family)
MSSPRLASISIDLDGLAHYARLHGLAPDSLPEDASTAVARLAPGRLAEILDERGTKGTFFVIGEEIAPSGTAALRAVAASGHEIGNHTRSHPYDLTRLSPEAQRAEIAGGAAAIEAALGVRPVGFRAPGYTLSSEVLNAAHESGHVYDSSAYPAAPYYLAKAGILGLMRLAGKSSAAILDRPRVLLAPRLPYRPSRDEPYARGGMELLELPITVDPIARVPFIGTTLCMLPRGALRLVYQSVRRLPFVNLELHGIDLLDATDGAGPELARAQRDLRFRAAAKAARLREVIGWLARDYDLVPLRDAADAWRSLVSGA